MATNPEVYLVFARIIWPNFNYILFSKSEKDERFDLINISEYFDLYRYGLSDEEFDPLQKEISKSLWVKSTEFDFKKPRVHIIHDGSTRHYFTLRLKKNKRIELSLDDANDYDFSEFDDTSEAENTHVNE